MTTEPGRRFSSVWPIWAWIMVAFGVAATVVAILGGVFARSLILDLISFWPGLIFVMLVAAALYPFHRGRWSRLAAVVPLLVLTWLGSTIALHAAEWSVLPSAAGDYDGPPVEGVAVADLSVVTTGQVSLAVSATDTLYALDLERRGGSTPPARSFERIEAGIADVVIDERVAETWFVTRGWRITLSDRPVWDLSLDAAEMTVDLSGAAISSLRLAGSGVVRLAPVAEETEVTVDGRFDFEVPAGIPVSVIGSDVSVPAGWTGLDGTWVSPASGVGYVVTVNPDASLVVEDA